MFPQRTPKKPKSVRRTMLQFSAFHTSARGWKPLLAGSRKTAALCESCLIFDGPKAAHEPQATCLSSTPEASTLRAVAVDELGIGGFLPNTCIEEDCTLDSILKELRECVQVSATDFGYCDDISLVPCIGSDGGAANDGNTMEHQLRCVISLYNRLSRATQALASWAF